MPNKKQKFYNPYRYKSMIVMYPGRGEIREYYKEKSTKRMHILAEHEQKIIADMINETKSETQKTANASISPQNASTLVKKYLALLKPISAEYVADFLIANNIARRGKLLHPDTAIKKLYKMQQKGSIHAYIAETDIINSTTPSLSYSAVAEPNLHYYLHKYYGVTLMDYTMYQYCTKQINLHKHENLVKKFHAAVINNKIQQLDNRPF